MGNCKICNKRILVIKMREDHVFEQTTGKRSKKMVFRKMVNIMCFKRQYSYDVSKFYNNRIIIAIHKNWF